MSYQPFLKKEILQFFSENIFGHLWNITIVNFMSCWNIKNTLMCTFHAGEFLFMHILVNNEFFLHIYFMNPVERWTWGKTAHNMCGGMLRYPITYVGVFNAKWFVLIKGVAYIIIRRPVHDILRVACLAFSILLLHDFDTLFVGLQLYNYLIIVTSIQCWKKVLRSLMLVNCGW